MLDNFFKLSENGTDFKTEIAAGITTFLAMAYILGVNPVVLSDGGMPATGVFFATAVASGVACLIMGLVARYPIGLAPGMGLNALFTYTIILSMGNTWETALAAVFLSSIIFFIITISGLREAILNAIPLDLKYGIGAAIGFFLAFLGDSSSASCIDRHYHYFGFICKENPCCCISWIDCDCYNWSDFYCIRIWCRRHIDACISETYRIGQF